MSSIGILPGMLGVAENNQSTINSVPVVYTTGLHDSKSGESHAVTNKPTAGCIVLNNALIKIKNF
jgi:hypothetical protein